MQRGKYEQESDKLQYSASFTVIVGGRLCTIIAPSFLQPKNRVANKINTKKASLLIFYSFKKRRPQAKSLAKIVTDKKNSYLKIKIT